MATGGASDRSSHGIEFVYVWNTNTVLALTNNEPAATQLGERPAYGLDRQPEEVSDFLARHRQVKRIVIGRNREALNERGNSLHRGFPTEEHRMIMQCLHLQACLMKDGALDLWIIVNRACGKDIDAGRDQRFSRAIMLCCEREPKHVTSDEEFNNLAATIGEELIKHHRAGLDPVDVRRRIAFHENQIVRIEAVRETQRAQDNRFAVFWNLSVSYAGGGCNGPSHGSGRFGEHWGLHGNRSFGCARVGGLGQ